MNGITQVTLSQTFSQFARQFFTTLGVNLSEPVGKAVFFNDRTGILLVKATEQDLELVPCMAGESCVFTGICLATHAVREALLAFIEELDRVTLADAVRNRPGLSQRLGFSAYLH